jgi:hypothetical protein
VAIPKRIRLAVPSAGLLVTFAIAVVLLGLAYDNGSYGLPSRNELAIAVWWAVIVGAGLRVLANEGLTRTSLVIGGILTVLGLWTFASVFWAPSAENAFNEFNRVSLFLGVFVLATLAVKRRAVIGWCNGLAVAVSLIALVALIGRLFPGSFSNQGFPVFLPNAATRLSFPVGYWNGLAILVALGLPLLLRIAVDDRRTLARSVSVVPIPAIICVIYLASSRGGFVTAVVGIVVFIALTEARWSAGMALFWAGAGSAAAIAVLASRNELINGPLGTSLVEHQGRSAAILVSLVCIASGAAYSASLIGSSRFALGETFKAKLGIFKAKLGIAANWLYKRLRLSKLQEKKWLAWVKRPRLGRGIVIALALVAVAGAIAASHPIRQFDAFKRSPAQPQSTPSSSSFVGSHLLSATGSGRWQFWGSAIKEWEHHPVLGEGAGSYNAWWTKDAGFFYPSKYAHSLYLQSLGELGILGLVLTLGFAVVGIATGVRKSLKSSGEERIAAAALTGVFAAFSVAAAFDWVWELTVVTVFALIALALLCSSSTTSPPLLHASSTGESPHVRYRRFGAGAAALTGAWLLICAQAIPLLAQLRIKDSQADDYRGNMSGAIRAAMDARNLQPWASSPYLQLALVNEDEGRIDTARKWIDRAIKRDSGNWQLWLVAARLDTTAGDARGAARALDRASTLNPSSPIFSSLKP